MRVAFPQSSSVTTVGSTSTTLFVSLSLHQGQMRNGFEIFHCLPQTAFTSFSFRLIPSPPRRLLLSTCPLPASSPYSSSLRRAGRSYEWIRSRKSKLSRGSCSILRSADERWLFNPTRFADGVLYANYSISIFLAIDSGYRDTPAVSPTF